MPNCFYAVKRSEANGAKFLFKTKKFQNIISRAFRGFFEYYSGISCQKMQTIVIVGENATKIEGFDIQQSITEISELFCNSYYTFRMTFNSVTHFFGT